LYSGRRRVAVDARRDNLICAFVPHIDDLFTSFNPKGCRLCTMTTQSGIVFRIGASIECGNRNLELPGSWWFSASRV
jgi:hypothetical protein